MKIQEICDSLNVTRQGLYWLLDRHEDELGNHVHRSASGRWSIDNEAVELLREIILDSKKVIIKNEPNIDKTISGMKLFIEQQKEEIEKLKLKNQYGVLLRNDIENVLSDHELEPEIIRALSAAVRFFNKQTSDVEIKKEWKKRKKEGSL